MVFFKAVVSGSRYHISASTRHKAKNTTHAENAVSIVSLDLRLAAGHRLAPELRVGERTVDASEGFAGRIPGSLTVPGRVWHL